MEPTKELAQKVLDTVDAGLVCGLGKPIPGQMCVEAAVNYAMGLPHDDKPACVSPAVRALKIALNDENWTTSAARAKGLRRLAIAQLGSAGVVDDIEFVKQLSELVIRKQVPIALRAAASTHPEEKHKLALEKAAVECETAADYAAASAAAAASVYHARSAADYAARSAASADYAARSVYHADKVLSDFAEDIVQILVGLQSPGVQWLDLTL